MKFDLKRPCGDCPFRNDRPGYLNPERVDEIEQALDQYAFTCHKTDRGRGKRERTQHCAGAMILIHKTGKPSRMMQLAERLLGFDPEGLDLTSPVFESFDEMRRAMQPGRSCRQAGSQQKSPSDC